MQKDCIYEDDLESLDSGYDFDTESNCIYRVDKITVNEAISLMEIVDAIYVVETIRWFPLDDHHVERIKYITRDLEDAVAIAAEIIDNRDEDPVTESITCIRPLTKEEDNALRNLTEIYRRGSYQEDWDIPFI